MRNVLVCLREGRPDDRPEMPEEALQGRGECYLVPCVIYQTC